jgi:outer membrane protein
MNRCALLFIAFVMVAAVAEIAPSARAQSTNQAQLPWPDRPLTLADTLNLAEAQNGAIAAAKKDLEAAAGVAIQTRAIVLPRLQLAGDFTVVQESSLERIDIDVPGVPADAIDFGQTEMWEVGVRLVQSIYEGGRLGSALRSARLTREAAIHRYQSVLLDTLLEVRVAYYDALLALEQIGVQEASVQLLERELLDNQRRFNAGNVPHFNVLRAEVELANARPPREGH